MKTKYWVVTTLVLFIAAISNATEIPKMNIEANNLGKAKVTFESPNPMPVEVTVVNRNGQILYYWKSETAQNKVSHQMDFSKLGNGTFDVCLNFGGQSISRKLCIKKDEMKIGPAEKMYEPYFRFEGEQLKVSFLNASQKNVYLNVFEDGQHVTGIKLGNSMDIQKCLDLSQLKKGSYEIILTEYFKDHNYLVQK